MNKTKRRTVALQVIQGLQELMKRDELTQAQLSEKSGIPLITLNRWFNGHRVPSSEMVINPAMEFLADNRIRLKKLPTSQPA